MTPHPRPRRAVSVPLAFLVLQLGCWFAMLGPHRDWLGSWRMAIDWSAGTVVICGPLLAGLVATEYAFWSRTSLPGLVRGSARPVVGWSAAALRLWLVALVSVMLVAGAVTTRTVAMGAPVAPRQLVILLPCAVVLLVHALIGMAIGLRVGPRAAGALAATLSFALFMLATRHLAPPSFVTGGVSGPMVGEQYDFGAVAALVGFAALSGVAVVGWAGSFGRPRRVRGALGAVALAGIFGLAQLGWPDLDGRTEPAAVHYECQGRHPQVCMADDVIQVLDAAAPRFRRLASPLRGVGAALPEAWRQSVPGQPRDPTFGTLDLAVEAQFGGEVADADLVAALTTPADCGQYYDASEPAGSLHARDLMARWIAFRNDLGSTEHADPWFSSAASEAWIRATYAQLRRCDLEDVRAP